MDRLAGDAAPSIAFLSYSSGEYDARTFRIARTAIAAGFRVTVYARWHAGLPSSEDRDGYRMVRVPNDWRLAVPGLRGRANERWSARLAREVAGAEGGSTTALPPMPRETGPGSLIARGADRIRRVPRRILRRIDRLKPLDHWHWWLRVREFPLRPIGWGAGLEVVAEPADIWHGMWAGSLPALVRLRDRHGGRAIYDSRDVFMRSRTFARLGWPGRAVLERVERRYAGRVDRVLTVNESYATIIERFLRVPRPVVVMNCPERWSPPSAPNLIREALGLPAGTSVVLYQGIFTIERGIEQAMEAILEVPNAVLALLGFGILTEELVAMASRPPYLGRVFVLPAVPPEALLEWTASADVAVMAIQPTTLNHRYTTPQKLFESLAAGTPVVASDLPGMADVVNETGAGILCDPTDPLDIGRAIRAILDLPPDDRAGMRARALDAARTRYNWETQAEVLLGLYRALASS